MIIWLVVWNIFYVSIIYGTILPIDSYFQRGWNHQPVIFFISVVKSSLCWWSGLASPQPGWTAKGHTSCLQGKKCLVTGYHKHSMLEPQPETSQVGAIHILLYGKRHPHLCLCVRFNWYDCTTYLGLSLCTVQYMFFYRLYNIHLYNYLTGR